MHTDVVNYNMLPEEIPEMLSGVKQCTCRYWQDKDIFTRMSLRFESVSAELKGDILRIDFADQYDKSALSITGSVLSATAATDGVFFDIGIMFTDSTEIHIFLYKL